MLNTKQDFQQLVKQICEPLKPYFTAEKATIKFGASGAVYDDHTSGIEAFARPLWGLAPLWMSGDTSCLDEDFLEGIKSGTNPESKEYWGDFGGFHQVYVEMAAMGYALALAPEKVWEPLNEVERKNLVRWLRQIDENDFVQNNWQFFRVLVNLGLKNVGEAYNHEKVEESLAIVEACYLGDGWYSDGKTSQKDYYIAFAIHFYSLIYAKLMREDDPERSQLFIDRAKLFAEDFIYWFTEKGDALPFGRSLTYRFAQCCFWGALVWNDVEVGSWGIMKGIICRHFEWWMQYPIFDHSGLLTIGYTYPNLHMSEGYNAYGSPYWALKAFVFLAVDEAHPFWQVEALPLPKLDKVREMPHAGMIMTRPEEGHIIALTSGQYANFEPNHVAEKYSKFAYSSYCGFNMPRSAYLLRAAVPDNMLAFERDGYYFVRRTCTEAKVIDGKIYSKWSPMQGVEVETTLEPHAQGHIRRHKIYSEHTLNAVECGFAVPNEDYPLKKHVCGPNEVTIDTEKGYSHMQLLRGTGEGNYELCESNTNLIHNRTIMPYIALTIEKGITEIEVLVVGLQKRPL